MFTERGVEQLTGWFLLAAIAVFIVHILLYVAGHDATTILLVLCYGILIGLSGVPLYRTFRSHDRTLASLGAFGLAAHGVLVVLVCTLVFARRDLGPQLALEPEALEAADGAIKVVSGKIMSSAFVLMGVGQLCLGILIAWGGAVARWVGWLGILIGSIGILGHLTILSSASSGGATEIAEKIVALTALLFVLGLGVRLIVRATNTPRKRLAPISAKPASG